MFNIHRLRGETTLGIGYANRRLYVWLLFFYITFTMPMRARWEHDCDECEFIGTFIIGIDQCDAYKCGEYAAIIRYGHEPAENYSYPWELVNVSDAERWVKYRALLADKVSRKGGSQ